jgi:ankyrin repeat protein
MTLRKAVQQGNIDEVRSILTNSADASVVVNNVSDDVWNTSLLHNAVNNHDIEMATLLLDHGACINRRDKFGRSPLWHASGDCDEIGMIKLLLDRGAWVTSTDFEMSRTPLHQAAWNGNVDIATLLLDRRFSVNDTSDRAGLTPLHLAIEQDHIDMAKLLLEHGANPYRRGGFWSDSPLLLVQRKGSADMKELFKIYIKDEKSYGPAIVIGPEQGRCT